METQTFSLPPLDYPRWHRWVAASQKLKVIEELMMFPAQGLGWLDCQLIAEDTRLIDAPPFEPARPRALNEQITLSYLWVLGGYELVRTIDQRHADVESLQSLA